jgi:hypothetical protein
MITRSGAEVFRGISWNYRNLQLNILLIAIAVKRNFLIIFKQLRDSLKNTGVY